MAKRNSYEDRLIGVIDQRARAKNRKQERAVKERERFTVFDTEPTPREKLDALFGKKMAVGSFERR